MLGVALHACADLMPDFGIAPSMRGYHLHRLSRLVEPFTREFAASRPVRSCRASGEAYPAQDTPVQESEGELTADDQNVVIERLKALGYLE